MALYVARYVPRLGEDDEDDEPARCAECGGHLGMEGGGGGADPCDCGGSFKFESELAADAGGALVAEAEDRLEGHVEHPGDWAVVEVEPVAV